MHTGVATLLCGISVELIFNILHFSIKSATTADTFNEIQ